MAEPNFSNRTLYHGDNLEFLRGLNSESVDLIATDPPFNKGRDFHATPDSLSAKFNARFQDRWSWERDVHEEWVDQIQDDHPGVYEVIDAARTASGDDMGAFLAFLGVRLIEMHRVLKPTGSIYLHIDSTAHAWVKCLMDGIFGRKNFINEIVWTYKYGGRGKKSFGKKHDTILFYQKSSKGFFNLDAVRIPHEKKSLKLNFRHTDENGRRYRTGTWKNGKEYRYYADEGRTLDDTWVDINSLHQADAERVGYPTQKPIALYERIIKASSKPGDVVLDPFCGCATTPIAAERQGRQWIGMDLWDKAHEVVLDRLNKEIGVGDGQGFNLHDLHYTKTPPTRTDDGEEVAPKLRAIYSYQKEEWEKLSHKQIRHVLEQVQGKGENIICAGCGIELPERFMELDHIVPRSDGGKNSVDNRILTCRPCNGKKSNQYTLSGLIRQNKRDGWLQNEDTVKTLQARVRNEAEFIRSSWGTPEVEKLVG